MWNNTLIPVSIIVMWQFLIIHKYLISILGDYSAHSSMSLQRDICYQAWIQSFQINASMVHIMCTYRHTNLTLVWSNIIAAIIIDVSRPHLLNCLDKKCSVCKVVKVPLSGIDFQGTTIKNNSNESAQLWFLSNHDLCLSCFLLVSTTSHQLCDLADKPQECFIHKYKFCMKSYRKYMW